MQCHFDLGQNKMVQQKLYSPEIKEEVARGPKRAIFPSFYFVQGWTGRYIGQTRSTLHYKLPYITVHRSRTIGCITLHYIHASNLRLVEFMVICSEYALLIAS